MDAVQAANSGHPGLPMGAADIATVLFTKFLKIDPRQPDWPDRDRFVLSAGHGSMLLYALHYLMGFEDMTRMKLKTFASLDRAQLVTQNMVTPPVSKPQQAHSVRVLQHLSVWRLLSVC